ncbi:periodic tryptophan protein 1 homolog [Aplysia californica]|uniref:Periodic tryptophan protein 1 homolog n=1 Tax=Aplysia californica TaxID=6500 RepID=A0ABM1AAK5_APLCA|nr:periodic tryptophan protein 1 homolog [Aplysia californica]
MSEKNSKNIVPCLLWVKQGCAKQKPDKVSLDKDELKKIIQRTQEKLDGVEDDSDDALDEASAPEKEEGENNDEFAKAVQKAKNMAASIKKKAAAESKKAEKRKRAGEEEEEDDIVDKYGLEDYDDDESPMDFLQGIGGLTPFASNEEDPYITLKDDADSDDEDFELKPSDNLIALGRVTEEAAILEVHIYNAEQSNLFIHHDYVLPTFPLVLEWLDYDVADGQTGNFVAMGTMEPDISLWDLDVVDSLEPVSILEGVKPIKKKKKMKKKETLSTGHSDAVLDLSWNRHVRNVLASASADQTVRLWDLAEGKTASTLTHHSQQVQCVAWHPVESQSLLTGSFDKRNNLYIPICVCPQASTDQGNLYCVDIRQDKPVYTLSAHEQAVTGLSFSSQIPGLVVTTSPDKHFKVWDVQGNKPSLVLSRKLHMDILHCVSCNPDEPFVFAVGANKDFKVWDIRESAAVRRHFLDRMPSKLAAECEGDDEDLLEDAAAAAMENLNMDDEDAAEEEEMLAGDRPVAKASGEGNQALKAKKKKKKKKKKGGAEG